MSPGLMTQKDDEYRFGPDQLQSPIQLERPAKTEYPHRQDRGVRLHRQGPVRHTIAPSLPVRPLETLCGIDCVEFFRWKFAEHCPVGPGGFHGSELHVLRQSLREYCEKSDRRQLSAAEGLPEPGPCARRSGLRWRTQRRFPIESPGSSRGLFAQYPADNNFCRG